jgi:hypothetical protein
LMYRLPGSDNPTNPTFWGIMSLATMAGMVTAYPINSWMVARGIKHGMMSAPSPEQTSQAPGHEPAMAMPSHASGHEPAMDTASSPSPGHEPAMAMDMDMGSMSHGAGSMDHHTAKLSPAQTIGIFLLTFACLIAAVWITSWFAELQVS